ncbi:RHS repeat domain-containing protein [Paenibacillus rhizoplanae]
MGDLTQQIYDKGGRVIQVTGPFGRESKQDYDRAGNIVATYQKLAIIIMILHGTAMTPDHGLPKALYWLRPRTLAQAFFARCCFSTMIMWTVWRQRQPIPIRRMIRC